MEFAAWVPNVTGHLSFSAVGGQLAGDVACCNNLNRHIPPHILFVAVAQRRKNDDSSTFLPRLAQLVAPLRRALLERFGQGQIGAWTREWLPVGQAQHFFMLAKPVQAMMPYFDRNGTLKHRLDERGALEGSVFIAAEETEQPYRYAQRNQLNQLRRTIEILNSAENAQDIESDLAGLQDDVLQMSDTQVSFTLYRTGECRLRMPIAEAGREGEQALLVRHAYYFIRDTAHRHYHHASRDDRLLPAVEVGASEGADDIEWRREVLWALTRTIGEYRRSRSMAQRRQALGITAYADAFQATLARIRRSPAGPDPHIEEPSLATFDFKHLRESAKVGNEVSAWRRQGGFSVAALTIASIISLTALWVALSRLATERGWKHSGPFASVMQWFYGHPVYTLAAAIGGISIVWDATYSEHPVSDRLFKTLLGISWPSKAHGRRARARVYIVAILVALILVVLIDFQFELGLFG